MKKNHINKKIIYSILVLLCICVFIYVFLCYNDKNISEDKNILNRFIYPNDNSQSVEYADYSDYAMSFIYIGRYGEDADRRYKAHKDFAKVCEKGELTKEIYDYYCENFRGQKYYRDWDIDDDGLSNYEEYELYYSDPNKYSTSGDNLSDGFKVLNNLDINKYYEPFWIKCRDNFYIKTSSSVDAFKEGMGDGPFGNKDYLYINGLYSVNFYYSTGTKIKFYLPDVDMSSMEFEMFSNEDYTRNEMKYKYIDGFIEFELGDCKTFLLYPKGLEFNLQDSYLKLSEKDNIVVESYDTGYKEEEPEYKELTYEEKYVTDYPTVYYEYEYDSASLAPNSELIKDSTRISSKYYDISIMKRDLEDKNYDRISEIYDFSGLEGEELEKAQREKLELLIQCAKEYIKNKEINYTEYDYYPTDDLEGTLNKIKEIKNSDLVNED